MDKDHRTILAFLRAGKVENAVTALERHVQWIEQAVAANAALIPQSVCDRRLK